MNKENERALGLELKRMSELLREKERENDGL